MRVYDVAPIGYLWLGAVLVILAVFALGIVFALLIKHFIAKKKEKRNTQLNKENKIEETKENENK